MKLIPLTQGRFAKVDNADFPWLNQWKWCLSKVDKKEYAVRNDYHDGKNHYIRMHVAITGPIKKGLERDHIDGDGLNNQRRNLRICTKAQNLRNRKKPTINDELYTGIHTYNNKKRTKWRAIIGHGGVTTHLGMFNSPEDAARAYDKAAQKYFGEYARLNFPEAA